MKTPSRPAIAAAVLLAMTFIVAGWLWMRPEAPARVLTLPPIHFHIERSWLETQPEIRYDEVKEPFFV